MSNTPTLVRRSRIGELLVAEGKLSPEELAAALAYREERGLKLGQALVALHLVTQQDLAQALRSQGRVHCLHLSAGIVDAHVSRLLSEEMARKYVAVPVHRVAGRVTVAMEDPSEEYDVDAIAVAIGEPIFAVHAEPERILEAITRAWPAMTTATSTAPELPRFTLVRGSLPQDDPDLAALTLVRAALREAKTLRALSFHVESTSRGAEMSFRVDRARTPAALFPVEWADACARTLLSLAGAGSSDERAAGRLELDGEVLDLDVATITGQHGRCVRATIRPPLAPTTIDDLDLQDTERARVVSWLSEPGVVLIVGAASSSADAVAADLARRAARAGSRVYRLGAVGEPDEGVVHVRRGQRGDAALDLRAILEQSPEVVETGLIAGRESLRAALDLARRGALVLVRVEARDGAAAACEWLAASSDFASASPHLVGWLAIAEVRLARAAGAAGPSFRRIAEVFHVSSAPRSVFARGTDATQVREAVRALGTPTLETRGRELVADAIACEAEIERALRRAAGVLS